MFDEESDQNDDDTDSSALTEIGDDGAASTTSDGSSDQLIPKPQGQAGRPNRGGYNLEVALNWPPKTFTKMQVSVQILLIGLPWS